MHTHFQRRARAWLPAICVSGLALLLYLSTLAPSVYWSDSAELQRAALTLEPPHPTGYPLYLLLGRLWIAALPLRDVAWRMNLLSALLSAAAVGVVTWSVQRRSGRLAAGVAAGIVLASAASFWSQAIVAEVYALHALLIALLLAAALADRPRLPLIALLLGTGIAHHRMTLLMLPGLVVWLALRRAEVRHDARTLAASAGAFLLGFTPYVVTYMRGDWASRRHFLAYVTHSARQYWSLANLPQYAAETLWPVVSQQLSVAGAALAALGVLHCVRNESPHAPADTEESRQAFSGAAGRQRGLAEAALLGVSWVLGLAFLLLYRPPDMFSFAGAFQVTQAMLIGMGVAAVLEWLANRSVGTTRTVTQAAFVLLLAAALAVRTSDAYAASNLLDEEWLYPRQRATQVLDDLQSNSALLADHVLGQTMRYLRDVEGVRTDTSIVIGPEKTLDAALGLLATGRPAFVWGTGWLDALAGSDVEPVPADNSLYVEGLYRLVRPGFGAGGQWHEVGRNDETGLVASVRPYPLVADELAQVRLCRERGAPVVFEEGQLRLSMDADHDWLDVSLGAVGAPGTTDGDRNSPREEPGCRSHTLVMPPAPHAPQLDARLWIETTAQGALGIAEGQWAVSPSSPNLTPERMTARTPPRCSEVLPPADLAQTVGLVGAHAPPDTRPGVGIILTAYWWSPPATGLPAEWQLVDPHGAVVDQAELAPLEAFDASLRPPALVAQSIPLTPPHTATPGTYRMRLTVRGSGLDSPTDVCSVSVLDWDRAFDAPPPACASAASLDAGAVVLLGYDAVVEADDLDLTLHWRSEAETTSDWKVFVHLRGADGEIVAQADGYPGGGFRHTSGWTPGEIVLDEHVIDLSAVRDSPGVFRVVVGMYDPDSGGRASVELPTAGREAGHTGGSDQDAGGDAGRSSARAPRDELYLFDVAIPTEGPARPGPCRSVGDEGTHQAREPAAEESGQ